MKTPSNAQRDGIMLVSFLAGDESSLIGTSEPPKITSGRITIGSNAAALSVVFAKEEVISPRRTPIFAATNRTAIRVNQLLLNPHPLVTIATNITHCIEQSNEKTKSFDATYAT